MATANAVLLDKLNRLANAQFDTPEFLRLISLPLTVHRARCYTIHMAHYVNNRRDCWGYVQGAAPLFFMDYVAFGALDPVTRARTTEVDFWIMSSSVSRWSSQPAS